MELIALIEDVRRLYVSMDDWRIVRVDVIKCVQDMGEHPIGHSSQHVWPFGFFSFYQGMEAALINRHEAFDVLTNLKSLGVFVWHDIVLM